MSLWVVRYEHSEGVDDALYNDEATAQRKAAKLDFMGFRILAVAPLEGLYSMDDGERPTDGEPETQRSRR